jgi:hypothetical protein
MGRENDKNRQEAQTPSPAGEGSKKPYSKPVLRKLGTVRELTHGHPSQGAGK